MTTADALLAVENLSVAFAGLKALDRVNFSVGRGQIFGLIGPNGAGKTTMLNCLTRIYPPSSGKLTFDGIDLLATPLHKVNSLGIARTFQNLELLEGETAVENVLMGVLANARTSVVGDILGTPSARRADRLARERAIAALDRLGIADSADRVVSTLPYGIQKRVELARALVTEPKLLLLDEPAAGLNSEETHAVSELLVDLRRRDGLTSILIEHDMPLVMSVCDEILVLDHGEAIACGAPAAIQADQKVVVAYLGEEDTDAA